MQEIISCETTLLSKMFYSYAQVAYVNQGKEPTMYYFIGSERHLLKSNGILLRVLLKDGV